MGNQARKNRQNAVGITAQSDRFADIPPDLTVVQFPDRRIRKRVVIERPAPPPTMRTCPTCGALFEDHTRRINTAYCRAWCKTKMSYIKKDTAIQVLSQRPGMDADKAFALVEIGGLPKAEKILNSMGFVFNREQKGWYQNDSSDK